MTPRGRDGDRAPALDWASLGLDLIAAEGREAVIAIRGPSMRPTVPDGTRVRVRPARQIVPRLGDVVLFRQGGVWVAHRVVGRARACPGGLRTRGDGRARFDPVSTLDDLVARVVAIERDGTWRSLEGAGARAYGVAVAVHGMFWGGLAAILGGRRGREGAEATGLARVAAALDRLTLRAVDRVGFRVLHRRERAEG